MTRDEHKALNDAVNLLCRYVEKTMPPGGFELRLNMRQSEADISLYDPNGNKLLADSCDCPIADAVEIAWEAHNEMVESAFYD